VKTYLAIAIASAGLVLAYRLNLFGPSKTTSLADYKRKQDKLFMLFAMITLHFGTWMIAPTFYAQPSHFIWFWIASATLFILTYVVRNGDNNLIVSTFALVIGLGVVYGIKRIYDWSVDSEDAKMRSVAQAYYQAEQSKLNLAKKLQSGIVIPSKETTFVVLATDKVSPVFIPPQGFCIRNKAVNPAHSFVITTQRVRHIDMPNTDTHLGNIEYFTLESYGNKATEVRVSISKFENGRCKPSNR
jgi:hypothetical protein